MIKQISIAKILAIIGWFLKKLFNLCIAAIFNFSAKIVQTERNTKRKAKRFSLGIAEVQPILSKDSANERNIKIKTSF